MSDRLKTLCRYEIGRWMGSLVCNVGLPEVTVAFVLKDHSPNSAAVKQNARVSVSLTAKINCLLSASLDGLNPSDDNRSAESV